MPIFEYRCEDCAALFEKIQRHASEKEPCPACGGNARRAVSAPVAGTSPSGVASPAAPSGCGGSGFT